MSNSLLTLLRAPLAFLVLLYLSRPTRAFATPAIPLNWTTLSLCAIDNPARILANDITTQFANNTPAGCVASCAAQGFGYAGVEFGNECHCGSGIQDGPLESAPITDCDVACTGNANFSCGGAWRIQLYTFPALRPGTWTYEGCTVDAPAAPAFADAVVIPPFDTTLDAVNQCLQACARGGFTFAGVEDAGSCQCSAAGIATGVQQAQETDCNSLCPLPGAAGFEFCGGVERLGVYKFSG